MKFWVEYVVRNGPKVLRSPAMDLYWWEVALLDVYGFILLCFIIIIYLILLFTKFALRILTKSWKRNFQIRKKKDWWF